VRPGPVTAAEAARAVLDARAGGPPVAVIGRADEGGEGRRILVSGPDEALGTLGDPALDRAARALGEALLARAGAAGGVADAATVTVADVPGAELFGQVHRRSARLFVVGAGHIALPLTRLGVLLGFDVVVLDDREEFATEARFPDAARVRRVDFADPFAADEPGPDDSVVLVTRAHRYDFDCLRRLVTREGTVRYIGMVGSRRRVRVAFRALRDAGVPAQRLSAIHAPIGLDIGAETPEEIAVAIAAELVAVRRGVDAGGSLRDRERVVERWGLAGETTSASTSTSTSTSSPPTGADTGRAATVAAPASQGVDIDAAPSKSKSKSTSKATSALTVDGALLDAAAAGRRVVLATVVGARGSTPRGVGSRMLIDPGAGLVGTIGGGCGEGDVIAASSSVLETGRPRRVRVELTEPEDSWSPAVCGGVMDILLEPVEPDVD
jgi:xanthine dehydrogenase accessory factor